MAGINELHLPDLMIQRFRGVDELSIPRLGRVTLLAGKNGVGKTTVLDAVRVYAERGRYTVLFELLRSREEVSSAFSEVGVRVLEPDLAALFYGWDIPQDGCIVIGPGNAADQLKIEPAFLTFDPLSAERISLAQRSFPHLLQDVDKHVQVLRIKFRDNEQIEPLISGHSASTRNILRIVFDQLDEPPPGIECESLGPGLVSNNDLARFWDGVVLTNDEGRAMEAMRLIFGNDVDRVAVVGEDMPSTFTSEFSRKDVGGRRVMVKLRSYHRPVPLKSLGDGALRLFGVALALANSKGGFLLIDEVENGIHHSVQRNFWRMVLKTAQENNVQVLATTHSWDCVRGFALASSENEDAEGILVRLSMQDGKSWADVYSKKNLWVAAEQGFEVR